MDDETIEFLDIECRMVIQLEKIKIISEAYNLLVKLGKNYDFLNDLLTEGGGQIDEIITAFNMSEYDLGSRCEELISEHINGEFMTAIYEDGYFKTGGYLNVLQS